MGLCSRKTVRVAVAAVILLILMAVLTFGGGYMFYVLEKSAHVKRAEVNETEMTELRELYVQTIWDAILEMNVLDKKQLQTQAELTLLLHEQELIRVHNLETPAGKTNDTLQEKRKNYEEELWTLLSNSPVIDKNVRKQISGITVVYEDELKNLLAREERIFTRTPLDYAVYSWTIYTTIGYGHIYTLSFWGKFATAIYSVFAIPIFFSFIGCTSEVMVILTRSCGYFCANWIRHHPHLVVTLCCLLGFVFTIGITFACAALMWLAEKGVNDEMSDYKSNAYLAFVSLLTIGFGDQIPKTWQSYIIITVGLFFVAFAFNLFVRLWIRIVNPRRKVDIYKHEMLEPLNSSS